MRINATIDISKALKVFALVTKKLSYAVNNSLTRVAKEAVAEGQREIAADFTIRKRFILTRLKILQYSKRSNLTTVVGIDQNVQGSPLLLGFFEEGGTKLPEFGSEIAVPITGSFARPSFPNPIKNALKYTNLQIERGKGRQRTYVVPGVGIFERISVAGPREKGATRKPSQTVLIYKFESSAPLHKHMSLIAVMSEVVANRFAAIFLEEFEKEVTSQRPKK
jgi:hypothetical protein